MIATHVSRPIRSASASGPIGCAKPSFAIVSIASGSATPSMQRVRRLVDERHQDPVRDEAGEVARLGRRPCRGRARAATIARGRLVGRLARPRITSTSFSTGTGLKKCMPITRSGRFVAAASEVIGIEDVFDARTASAGSTRVGAAEDVLLHGRVLDDRLDHQVGGDELVDRRHAREHLVRRARRPSPRASSRLLRIVASPRSVAPGNGSCSETRRPGRGDDLRDAAAHLPRADDEDVLELHAAREPTLPERVAGIVAQPIDDQRALRRRPCTRLSSPWLVERRSARSARSCTPSCRAATEGRCP